MMDAKVTYTRRDGLESTAYIDEETGEGTDKHSDIPVVLEWTPGPPFAPHWKQIDTWEWRFHGDTFVRDYEAEGQNK